MDVKPGFKLTEVGEIPEDWDVARLGSLIRSTEYGSSSPSKALGAVPVLRMGNLQGGKINWSDLVYTDNEAEIRRYELQRGDVLFNRTNTIELVGKTSIYEADRRAIFAGYLIRVIPRRDVLDPRFLTYVMNTPIARNYSAQVLSVAVGQANINAEKLKTYPIPMPPKLEEQCAIAAALTDVDMLIEGLDRLIAKKRDLKQAAMQQLLTGQTRLPGFSGKWEVKRLGELGTFLKGSGVKKDEARSGNLPCIRYGEIYTHHNDYVRSFNSWISRAVAATATPLRRGDILFAGSGETKEEIGKCVAFVDDVEAYSGGDIVILRPNGANSLFLGYLLNTPAVASQKASRGQGDAVVHISAKALASLNLSLPNLSEQGAIAAVLSDMDAELAALEARRDKTRDLKQAMMQALLTGKTRLVKPEAAHA